MNTGIIGYGKMGREIFSLLSEKLPNERIIVAVRHDSEEYIQEYRKTLSKSLKRGRISQEQYQYRSENTIFTTNLSALSECDSVIESVSEDLELKRSVFRQLCGIVQENCLLLTNTSSLDISAVFDGIPNRGRCLGMHFFYPVKLSGYTELNIIPENTSGVVEKAKDLIVRSGKIPLVFSGEMHMFLNQMLACTVSHGIYLCEFLGVSPAELEKTLSAMFPAAGIFEIIDSIGIGLMAKSTDNFRSEKNRQLFSYGKQKIDSWIKDGCPEGSGEFLEYITANTAPTGRDCSSAGLYMAALLINELYTVLRDYDGSSTDLINAVKDITGLAEDPEYYIGKYSIDMLNSALDELYRATGSPAYLKESDIF